MNQESHTLLITGEERECILKLVTLPTGLAARFRFALHQGDMLEITFTTADLESFLRALSEAMEATEDPALIAAASAITKRNTDWDPSEDFIAATREMFPEDMPEEVFQQIRTILEQGDFASSDEAFEAVQAFLAQHNSQPLDEFQGLSPEQVYGLLYTNWEGEGAIRVSKDLSPSDVVDSPMAQHALKFLQQVADAEPVRLTSAGNLNRAFVLKFAETMQFPRWDLEEKQRYMRKMDEADVMPLHLLHILTDTMGLLKKLKGKLTLSKAGRHVLDNNATGTMQADLFLVMCLELNLAYLDRMPDYPEIQATYAISIYRLSELAATPVSIETLSEELFIDSVLEEMAVHHRERHRRHAMITRILYPLRDFGLLTLTTRPSECGRFEDLDTVQITPLFHKMFNFSC